MPADSSAPPMGQETQIATEGNHDQRGIGIASTVAKPGKKLSLIPLIFLIYFEVSGGPYGEEQTLQAAGPLFAIIGFVVFPIIWCIPEALITAELATAYPGNGGYVIWATEAFGPFWGFLLGWWKWVSGVINDAAFPVLFADYGKQIFPDLADGTPIRKATLFIFSFVLGILNYTGLSIIGWTSVALAIVSLLPCILMLFFAIPKIRPERWLSRGDSKKDWGLYLNNLFWNLNFWDSISTLAGEVENPAKTFPTALFVSGLLVCISYLIPILAGTGAMELNQTAWEDGYLAQAAATIAGQWLKIWIEIGALFSSVGLFNAQLSSCSYQLLGMAELGHLPSLFAKRSKWFNTPWVGILASMVLTIPLSYMSFTVVVSAANFMYSCGMLLEFAAFVWLRRKVPGKERPFRVPMGIPGLIGMLVVPTAFIGCVMVLAGKVVFAISAGLTVLGLVVYVGVWLCKSNHWLEFSSPVKEREVSSSGGV